MEIKLTAIIATIYSNSNETYNYNNNKGHSKISKNENYKTIIKLDTEMTITLVTIGNTSIA